MLWHTLARSPLGLFAASTVNRSSTGPSATRGATRLTAVLCQSCLHASTETQTHDHAGCYMSDASLSGHELCSSQAHMFLKRLTLEFPQVDQSVVSDNPERKRDLDSVPTWIATTIFLQI